MELVSKKDLLLEQLEQNDNIENLKQTIVQISGIKDAYINSETKVLSIIYDSQKDFKDLLPIIQSTITNAAPNIIAKEKLPPSTNRRILYLQDLSCADCAQKIENEVQALSGVKSINLDFVSQKITLEVNDLKILPSLISQTKQIVAKLEPGVKISDTAPSGSDHEHEHTGIFGKIALALGVVLFIVGMLVDLPPTQYFLIFAISYLLIGGPIVWQAIKNILNGQVFDEYFLMSIATLGAFAIGEYPEGVAVMLFYQIGELFQHLAVDHARNSVAALMDIRPDFANVKIGDELYKVDPDQISLGDTIVVKPGEKIPLDGIVIDGNSSLDTSALTGESIPRDVGIDDEVLSGSINYNGLLSIKTTKEFGDSTISKILDLVENASSKKAPTEQFITKFARYYTPVVVFLAVALAVIPPLIIEGAQSSDWIHRALVFLVISCPCALVISVPLSFFGGIGGASKNGILIKGSNYLEALNDINTIVFDKTGTLTKGIFTVTNIKPASGISEEDLLFYAAYAESHSNHPIATSIQKTYNQKIDQSKISHYEEIAGNGISVSVNNKKVLAGNSRLLESNNITYDAVNEIGTIIYLAIDNKFAGSITISDQIKSDSKQAIQGLKDIGVKQTVMLTGDNKIVGEKIATELGLDAVYSELLPHQKVEKLELLYKEKTDTGKLAFVGDGINDAPVLARADIGIAMGGVGSDAAIEAADIVIMTDEPSKIITAIKIAKKTRRIVLQNITFALVVKGIILIFGAMGLATMWQAVFGDVGVTLIAVINAMRALRAN